MPYPSKCEIEITDAPIRGFVRNWESRPGRLVVLIDGLPVWAGRVVNRSYGCNEGLGEANVKIIAADMAPDEAPGREDLAADEALLACATHFKFPDGSSVLADHGDEPAGPTMWRWAPPPPEGECVTWTDDRFPTALQAVAALREAGFGKLDGEG